MDPRTNKRASLVRRVRQASQGVSLLLWLALLFPVVHDLALPLPADLFLALDPLSSLSAAMASRAWVPGLLLGGLCLLSALLLGRVFCGWVCPLGTLLDLLGAMALRVPAGRLLHRIAPRTFSRRARAGALWQPRSGRTWKLLLLLVLLTAAPFGLQLAYLLDPIPLLTRGVALLGLPQTARPVAFPPQGIAWASASAASLLCLVLLLGLVTRRFWCRYLCPLGALLSLVSRFSLFQLLSRGCNECARCARGCPMGIRDPKSPDQDMECIRCYLCATTCRIAEVGLGTRPRGQQLGPVDLSRRAAVGSLTAGALLGWGGLVLARGQPKGPGPLRPPYAAAEERFLAQCVRCGACVRVCPTGTLRPFFLEAGVLALWTPEMLPTLGGCKPECTACSDACPTGAIGIFDLRSKYAIKAGTAHFDLRYCIAYGPGSRPCSICLDVCPTDAFVTRTCGHGSRLKPREVIYERCMGCGLCEYVCTIETGGMPALVTSSLGRGEATRL